MKRTIIFFLIICTCLCGNVFAAEDITLTGVINEVYITDGMGDKVQCLILTLDEEKTFDVYDDTGDMAHIKTNEIQLSSKDYKSDMDGKRVTVKGNDLLQGISFYHIRPVMLLNAEITQENKAEPEISVEVNGETIQFDQPPIMKNDRVLVPLRAIAEALNFNVEWNEYYGMSGAVILSDLNDKTITLCIDSAEARINNLAVMLDTKPIILNERTLVPIRMIAQTLNCGVEWDDVNRLVCVTSVNANDFEYNKTDKSKPLVYTAIDKKQDGYQFKLPAININTDYIATINNQIKNKYNFNYFYGIDYFYTINNDILSLVITTSADIGCEDHFFFNYDLKNDKELTSYDLISKLSITEEEYLAEINKSAVASFECRNGDVRNNGQVSESFYNEQRERAKNIAAMDTSWFITGDGNINFNVLMPEIAGGDYDYVVLSGLQIK